MGNIKTFCCLVAVSLCCAAGVVQAGSDSLAQFHFVGAQQVATNTNAAKLTKIWSTPLSREVVNRSVNKAAVGVAHFLSQYLGTSANNPDLISPLLNDVLISESSLDSKRDANGGTELVFAIHLSEDRAKVWSDNLQKLIDDKAAPVNGDGLVGWEVKRNSKPALVRFIHAKQWVVIGSGEGELRMQSQVVKAIEKSGRIPEVPEELWLQAEIDWPKLQAAFPRLTNSPFRLARTEIKVSGKADNLRTTVRATYPEPLRWKEEKWNLSVGLIRDPIISFTAFQNLNALVKSPKQFAQLGFDPLIGQTFIWAQSGSPFHTHVAHPTANPKKDFETLAVNLPRVYGDELKSRNAGKIVMSANQQEIAWSEMPVMAPFIRTTNTVNGPFLFGGLFPPLPLTNPPPPELISQVTAQKNLIYYDWEITQERLGEWQVLSRLLPFSNPTKAQLPPTGGASGNAPQRTRALAQKWMTEIAPQLGNTATEVKLAGPNEVSFARKSPIGFTSFELLMLSTWLTDSEFRATPPSRPTKRTK